MKGTVRRITGECSEFKIESVLVPQTRVVSVSNSALQAAYCCQINAEWNHSAAAICKVGGNNAAGFPNVKRICTSDRDQFRPIRFSR